MRLLKSEELYNGIYVQTTNRTDTVYQILIENNQYYYTVVGEDWKMDGNLVKDVWCETDLTIKLNRSNKINHILT